MSQDFQVTAYLIRGDSPFDMIPIMDNFHRSIRNKIIEPPIQWKPDERASVKNMIKVLEETEQNILHKEAKGRTDKLIIPLLKSQDSDSGMSSSGDEEIPDGLESIQDPDTRSFFEAAATGDTESVRDFIEQNLTWMELSTPGGSKLIHLTVGLNQIEILKILIQHGVDVNQPGMNGYTPLHAVAVVDDSSICEFLLSQPNIDVWKESESGENAFYATVLNDNIAVAKAMLTKFPPLAGIPNQKGSTPLMAAANWNYRNLVKLLLEVNPENVNAIRNVDNSTAL